ncbi:hypothetical protein VaNZ11_015380 [Volvox africanus]|uniref:SRCR domain-containing protein n=1 Tax=Volvox africanus TaxID=51714 RepID=A0ABQ5SKF3_9CHLO|nr:hypothetical protein VaNZ11_015380 [Volvox africanus]
MLNQLLYSSREVISRRNLRLRSALLNVLVVALSAVGITSQLQVPISTSSRPPPFQAVQPEDKPRPQLIASLPSPTTSPTTSLTTSSTPAPTSSPAPSPTPFPTTSSTPPPTSSSVPSPTSSPTLSPTPFPTSSPAPNPVPRPAPYPAPKSVPKTAPKPAPKPATKPAPKHPPNSFTEPFPKPSLKPSPKPAMSPSPKPTPKRPALVSSPKPATGKSIWQPLPRSHPPVPRRSSPRAHLSPPALPMMSPDRKNGLRLVRGAGRIGRLEARIVTEWFMQVGYNENDGWAPLCDDGSFEDQRAQEFCVLLGFASGRKYYAIGISTFAEDEPQPRPTPLGGLQCMDAEASRQAFPIGKIDLSDSLGYKCLVFPSACWTGALVALQCSNKPLRAKPPPPPLPPTAAATSSHHAGPPPPLPAAPNMQHAINLLSLEDNLMALWTTSTDFGSTPVRVELLVNSSADGRSGEAVWAPLCASQEQLVLEDYHLLMRVTANTSCHQQYEDFPTSLFSWLYGTAQEPAPIPKDAWAPSSGDSSVFDPSRYTHWVTVVGGVEKNLRSLQQMRLKVSTEPCETGMLFVITCDILMV